MRTIALYLTDAYRVSSNFILSGGIRYTNSQLKAVFSDTTFFPFPYSRVTQNSGAVNGNLGIVCLPGRDWKFSLLGSTGFRTPNVDDLAKVFESVAGRIIVPNPDIKPEYTYNVEAGISKVINRQAKLEGAAYYTWYKNALTVQPATFNGQDSIIYNGTKSRVITTANAGEAYIYGFSAGIAVDITNSFTLASTLNYTYGRIKTDSADYPLDHIPPMYGRTGFNLNLKKFRGEFFILYSGWKRLKDYNLIGEDNIIYATSRGTPAWVTLNVRMAYQLNEHVQVQAALENILDQNYRVFASGISAPGRNLVLTLRGRI